MAQFGSEETELLVLHNLPPSSTVYLQAKLFIIRSWDGNNSPWGKDYWKVEVAGGPVLFETTFSNGDPTNPAQNQSYPDSDPPGGDHPAQTGALESGTLGYQFGGNPSDSVYPIDLSFNYVGSDLTLRITGYSTSGNPQGIADESWGLDEVAVAVIG